MNLGLLTAIWGRPRLTELVLKYYDQLPIEWRVWVGSDDDETIQEHYFDVYDYESVEHPNSPLSDKWTKGITAFKDLDDIGAVMIVGSDDLVTPGYIEAAKYLIERGADYIFLPSLYFYDLPTGRMHYCMAERLGLGRVLSRRLLDMLNWQPWPEGLESGLDGAMWERVQALKEVKIIKLDLPTCKALGIAALDIKSDQNMWSYDHTTTSLMCQRIDDPETVLRKHFPSVADELLNWNEVSIGND